MRHWKILRKISSQRTRNSWSRLKWHNLSILWRENLPLGTNYANILNYTRSMGHFSNKCRGTVGGSPAWVRHRRARQQTTTDQRGKETDSMVWKCPKCSFRTKSYRAVQRHFFSKHHTSRAKTPTNKGKERKVYTFKPTVLKKR